MKNYVRLLLSLFLLGSSASFAQEKSFTVDTFSTKSANCNFARDEGERWARSTPAGVLQRAASGQVKVQYSSCECETSSGGKLSCTLTASITESKGTSSTTREIEEVTSAADLGRDRADACAAAKSKAETKVNDIRGSSVKGFGSCECATAISTTGQNNGIRCQVDIRYTRPDRR